MRILLVRPWIHDFAAYDLWIQPLGLLYIAGILAENGFELDYLDCLGERYDIKPDGRAKFAKEVIPTPASLKGITRYYGRFGISPSKLDQKLGALKRPDAILVTSGMTYWYPGVQETIRHLRQSFKGVEILLGGIYATLMPEHARLHSGAHRVIPGECENQIVSILTKGDVRTNFFDLNDYPLPAWNLTAEKRYRILYTSRGCPYRCTFCASDILNNQKFHQRKIENVLAEFEQYHLEDRIEHFVFYDDALLINHKRHLQPFLEEILRRGYNATFHTPNGLNAREVDASLAQLMHDAGFETIRLSLESVDPEIQKIQGNRKVTNKLFETAVTNLYNAGYKEGDLECYLIQGLPGQTAENIRDSLEFVARLGVIARLATYSPIPNTPEAESARRRIGDEFITEPLLQNHSVFPLRNKGITYDDLQTIKNECIARNAKIRESANRVAS